MALNRPRLLILILLGTILLGVVSLMILLLFLPGYLETRMIPGLAQTAGIDPVSLHIRKIGLTGADLADVTVGAPPKLAIDSIRIDYSPMDLLRGRIARICLNGISLRVNYRSGVLTIEGIEALFPPGSDSPKGTPASTPAFSVGSISIRNSGVTCRWETRTFHVPFELTAVPNAAMQGIDRFTLQLSPRDQAVIIDGSFLNAGKAISLCLTGEGILLERFSDLIGYLPSLSVGGRADIEARATLSVEPFGISSLSVSSRLHGATIDYKGIRIQNATGPDSTESPLGISLETQDFRSWHVGIPLFLCITPVGTTRIEASGDLTTDESTLTAEAVVQTGAFPEPAPPPSPALPVLNLPAFRWELAATYETAHGWRARVDGRAALASNTPKMTATVNGLRVQAAAPAISLAAKGLGTAFSGSGTLDIPAIDLHTGGEKITIPAVAVSSQFTHTLEDTGINKLSVKTRAQPVIIISKAARGRIPLITVIGNLSKSAGGAIGLSGRLEFADAGFSAPSRAVAINGISATIPFQWPLTGEAKAGKFSATSLQWQNLSLGGITATIQQRANGVVVSGNYNSRLLPGLSAGFNGNATLTERDWIAEGHVRLPGYRITDDIDLGRFAAEASGILCKGEISLSADLAASGAHQSGSMTLGLRDARVTLSDTGLILDGLSMNLAFPDALALRSAPRQVVRVSKVSLGNIAATDVSADFQVESPTSIFIEQSRFKWCGGNVDSQAFRISPGIHDYRLTLYCDRLNLAGILEQFGAAKADGNGTVNGRIPVTFSGKRLAFQDGFLYSTPGGGGKIKLAGSKMLTVGLPPDSPEAVQMAIANEALKDFEYTWVKLNLGTENNELLMQLKFDGKPVNPLPFVYKRDIGRFIRVEADAKGSVFQGIRLDVNFRLPLDDILKYKEILNRMN